MATMDRFKGITAQIDGQIFKRGFWLYIWDIVCDERRVLYVGRTGDSSSNNAASPFSRFVQHLNEKPNAKANSMLRHLRNAGIKPTESRFELFAVGPLFREQEEQQKHIERRDKVAALECALATYLRNAGYEVLGTHSSKKKLDMRLYRRLIASVQSRFPVQ